MLAVDVPQAAKSGYLNGHRGCKKRGGFDGLVVDPWPFCTARVSVRAEGKRLRGLFSTQEELIRTLDAATALSVP